MRRVIRKNPVASVLIIATISAFACSGLYARILIVQQEAGYQIAGLEEQVERLVKKNDDLTIAARTNAKGRDYEGEETQRANVKLDKAERKIQALRVELKDAEKSGMGWKMRAASLRKEGCQLESLLHDTGRKIRQHNLACKKMTRAQIWD